MANFEEIEIPESSLLVKPGDVVVTADSEAIWLVLIPEQVAVGLDLGLMRKDVSYITRAYVGEILLRRTQNG